MAPIAAGAYAFSRTPYGLYDMLGSVTEYTDTAGTIDFDVGRPQVFFGSWATPLADIGQWNVFSPPICRSSTTATGQVGFRVAVVQAVPEPALSPLLGAGVVGGGVLDSSSLENAGAWFVRSAARAAESLQCRLTTCTHVAGQGEQRRWFRYRPRHGS